MCSIRNKRLLAFLLCLVMAVSGVSLVRADESGETGKKMTEGRDVGTVMPATRDASGGGVTTEEPADTPAPSASSSAKPQETSSASASPSVKPSVEPSASANPSVEPSKTPEPNEKPSCTICVTILGPENSNKDVNIIVKRDGIQVEVDISKPEDGIYELRNLEDGNYEILVTKVGYSMGNPVKFNVIEGHLELSQGSLISICLIPIPKPVLTVSEPGEKLQKKGETISLGVTASVENAPNKYTIKYAWMWNGKKEKTSNNILNKKVTDIGKNSWKCEVTAVGDNGEKLTTKTVSGTVIGYQPSGIKITLLKKYSLKKICDTVFGKSSGVIVEKMKKKGNYLQINKDKIYGKKFKKNISVQLEGVKYGNTTFKNISIKMEMHLPLEVKFTKKNGGKKITCAFSKDLRKIAGNKKKYGIKQIKVKIWFSKDGKSYKAVAGAAKKYFQPTVAKSKCYITQDTKFKTKKFKAQITCKASGGTVKDKMKVTYK